MRKLCLLKKGKMNMKKIALILVFALAIMTLVSCSSDKTTDEDDIKLEDLLVKEEDDGKDDENKPKDNIKYGCVYENYTYTLYVDDNYLEITGYDFTALEAEDDAAEASENEEEVKTIDLVIPDKIDGVQVKKIARGAFERNTLLASVVVPEGVTEIAAEAFWYSYSLESIQLPSTLATLGERAFAYCSALTALEIPVSVTEIPAGLCTECSALADLTLGAKVASIGENAFAYCTALTEVEFGTSLTTIGAGAFKWCVSLTKADIPEGVKTVGEGAFDNCTSLVK